MRNLVTASIGPVLSFIDRLFGRRASALDLGLGLIAGGWLSLMIARPALFDRVGYSGMAWLPDEGWELFFAVVVLLHVFGLARPFMKSIRTLAGALSAWVWIFVSGSLAKVELTPGVLTYAVLGLGALGGAIYVSSLHSDGA